MNAVPKFRRLRDKSLILGDTHEAVAVRKSRRSFPKTSLPWDEVKKNAIAEVVRQGGDPNNKIQVLSQYQVQFGQYRGKTFLWLAENALGYAAYFVNDMRHERPMENNLSKNKFSFKTYLESFPAGKEAIQMKRKQFLEKGKQKQQAEMTPIPRVPVFTTPEKCIASPGIKETSEIFAEAIVAHVMKIESGLNTSNIKVLPMTSISQSQPPRSHSSERSKTPVTSSQTSMTASCVKISEALEDIENRKWRPS